MFSMNISKTHHYTSDYRDQQTCSWCLSSLSQRPLHTRHCHLRSSASAICSDWRSTGSTCPHCNWTTKLCSQRISHMEPSATSTMVTDLSETTFKRALKIYSGGSDGATVPPPGLTLTVNFWIILL